MFSLLALPRRLPDAQSAVICHGAEVVVTRQKHKVVADAELCEESVNGSCLHTSTAADIAELRRIDVILPVPKIPIEPLPAGQTTAHHTATRVTKRQCPPENSIPGTLRVVVAAVIPLQLAHQIQEPLLLTTANELLQRLRHSGLLGSFTAHLQGAFAELGIETAITQSPVAHGPL